MGILIVIAIVAVALVVLDLAAITWGQDSRENVLNDRRR